MTVRTIGFNTMGGVHRTLEIIECENPFLVGRKIIESRVGKRAYVGFDTDNKTDATDWKKFMKKHNIKSELKFESSQ